MSRGRRVIRSPLYASTHSPGRGSNSHNRHGTISRPVDLSMDSPCRGPYYAGVHSETHELPLTQSGRLSRQETVDVYSSESELSYPISFQPKSDSSTTTDVDRRTYAEPSQSHKVYLTIKTYILKLN
jgi:hypothetical protein